MSRARGPERSGILVVDKAAGVTSFDAVALVRTRLGVRRIGHGGTLDPDATGVLPVLVGEATKLMPYLVDQDKEYLATVRFGLTTDTRDLSGRVLSTAATPPVLNRDEVERAARPLVGPIKQVPPMYSALRRDGRRLYELARQGIEVDREPREVLVMVLDVLDVADARATLRVVCGKGTYIRVLAADLGAALGCGAALERLVRLRVGPFALRDAVGWAELSTAEREALWSRVLPAGAALAGWASVTLGERAKTAFLHGQTVEVEPPAVAAGRVRVHDGLGRLLGVGEASAGGRRVQPLRILHADRPETRSLPA